MLAIFYKKVGLKRQPMPHSLIIYPLKYLKPSQSMQQLYVTILNRETAVKLNTSLHATYHRSHQRQLFGSRIVFADPDAAVSV